MKKPSQHRHLRLVKSEENEIHGQGTWINKFDPCPGPYSLNNRIDRIKASISRINALMAELKEVSVKIYQVSITTEIKNDISIAIGRLGTSTNSYYDPAVKAFSSKDKAEEYIADLKTCYDKLYLASGCKLAQMKFNIREVEVD